MSGFSPFVLTFRSEKDKRDGDCLRIGPESSNDAIAVEFGHHDVAKNEVGLFFLSQPYSDAAACGG
jgi:hypothetical protein